MVGGELLTMCPVGEDHQGHDWGEKREVLRSTSRGNMILASRSWRRVRKANWMAMNSIKITHRNGSSRTSFTLMV